MVIELQFLKWFLKYKCILSYLEPLINKLTSYRLNFSKNVYHLLKKQLEEEVEQIKAFVSGEKQRKGSNSSCFVDEPLYQIYHCGAAAREMHRQNEDGT